MTERLFKGAQPALDVVDLETWYGASQALFGVSFTIMPGEVVGLVGRNGAGKTTVLRSVMGLLQRQSGRVAIGGVDTTKLGPAARARLGVGYCPEERAVFASLTVAENLALPPSVGPEGLSEAEILTLFPNLESRRHQYGGQLSGGEQQMLAIARILRTGARTLMFDEPTEGLAPVIVKQIEAALITLKRRGFTILLVEQNLAFVLRVADRIVAIEHGRVVAERIVDEPLEVERHLAQYLVL
ncbi:ABC transporter ATP-binding protein [Neorhizobium sp. P12A]|uniref:ABC transporter ATP-binding protein n=1 Tax=Neorhizobium sp. P12A TaxID=2268027 RepID=UPI001FEDFF3E|nr:ABC transporter ATP-binding protein [Neorhizobium sp. P12A]